MLRLSDIPENYRNYQELQKNQRTLTNPLGENAIITEIRTKSDAQNTVSPIQRNVINMDDMNRNEEIIYFGNIFFSTFWQFLVVLF